MAYKDKEILIHLNSGKQTDFVRWLFARVKIKELNKEIERLNNVIIAKETIIIDLNTRVKEAELKLKEKAPNIHIMETYKFQLTNTMNKSSVKGKKIKELERELNTLNIKYQKLKDDIIR